MSSMQEDIQCAGSDTRPPMLDRTDFESWQQRIRLYCLGKDNGENIMKSIKEGPFHMGTVSDVITGGTEGAVQQGPVRARVLNDLSAEEKERYKADIRATNILLQGIPKDIYSLINHYTDAKDIWENVKMILEGSELTKDDRESQLYDEFEHFRQIKGETIQGYYVRFTKLINDMRNIKMTMPRMQLNSKFVNNMLPEWSRFITEVKLNRGLKESNFDQLYAYLKQHEVHANENRIMMESYGSRRKVVVQDVRRRYNANNQGKPFQRNNARGNVVAGNVGVLDEEQSLFLAGEHVTNVDDDVDDSPENDLALNVDHVFEADECDAFDSDVDEGPTTQTMFMTNLTSEDRIYDEAGTSYDSNTPSEVHDHDTFVNHLDEYHEVHEMQTDEQHNYIVDSDADYTSNSNIIPYDQYVEDNEDHVVQRNVSSVRNDALMSILDEMMRYKELVGEYEKWAKFELTDREQKFDEQMRRLNDSTYSKRMQSLEAIQMKNRIPPAKKENKKEVEVLLRTNKYWFIKDTHRRNSPLGKTNLVYQWRPHRKDICLRRNVHLTKLSVKSRTVHAMVSGLRLFKTYDGNRFNLMNFVEKFIGSVKFRNDHLGAIMGNGDLCYGDICLQSKLALFVAILKGKEHTEKVAVAQFVQKSIEEMISLLPICLLSKASKSKSWLWHPSEKYIHKSIDDDIQDSHRYIFVYNIAQDAPVDKCFIDYIPISIIHSNIKKFAEEPTHEDTPINHDVLHPSHNPVSGDPDSVQSSSGNVNSAEPIQVTYPPDHLRRWTKDHPLDNIVLSIPLVLSSCKFQPEGYEDQENQRTFKSKEGSLWAKAGTKDVLESTKLPKGQWVVGNGEGELGMVLGRWFGLVNHGKGWFEDGGKVG
ncbi:hypothetical protein Tco_0304031 [Tanacetum coccineum]